MADNQTDLNFELLRWCGRNAPAPESFKLFCGAFLRDMFYLRGERPALEQGGVVYFKTVLCRGDIVLSASMPQLLLLDGKREEVPPGDLAALRAAGFPLVPDFPPQDGKLFRDLRTASSGWRFPSVPVPPALNDLLNAKGLMEGFSRSAYTLYGTDMGLCLALWLERDPDNHLTRKKRQFCSAAGWVRMWEQPWKGVPDWAPVPLDVRLERIRANRPCNPGHCMAAFRQLEVMPMAPAISLRMSPDSMEYNLQELRTLFGSGITYGQAARNAARLLRSDSMEERKLGNSILRYMVTIYEWDYGVRLKDWRWEESAGKPEIVEAKAEDRSFSARLARAGIFENDNPYLPLAGDHLEDVFEGLCRLAGTDAPARKFYQDTLARPRPQWDGSFDGLIRYCYEKDDLEGERSVRLIAQARKTKLALLIEPLCLLDQIRELEEKHSELLGEIRERNKRLKKKLERMKAYVN